MEAELAAVRKQLADVEADAERRIDAVKRQLIEAKTKAKAVIQRSMAGANDKINLLTEQNRLQSDELSQLKAMLRTAEHEKATIANTSSLLQNELEDLRSRTPSNADNSDALREQISELQSELQETKQQLAENDTKFTADRRAYKERSESDSANIFQLNSQLEDAKNQLASLQLSISEQRPEVPPVAVNDAAEDQTSVSEDVAKREKELKHEVDELTAKVGQLQSQLEEARQEKNTLLESQGAIIEKLESEKSSAEQRLRDTEESVKKLEADVVKSENALKAEREMVSTTEKAASNSMKDSKEDKLMQEAKIAELERVIASKQAEIGKVREKAKTYLKELNAEKRDMESKMKQDVEALRKELTEEQQKIAAAEQRADNIGSELESCLVLIREKEKSLQMLRMAISTEKKTASEAVKETEALRVEFSKYKERARIALQEKQSAVANSDEAIEAATFSLRKELESSRKEMSELRDKVRAAKADTMKFEELLNRAQRAEAAVDLLRADAKGSSTENYGKIDMLEEKISQLKNELSAAHSATGDAEARHETTKMRLEALEKALRSAELRAEEAGRVANKTIEGLVAKIASLEDALERAQESSKAAQRTAAAAAKAMAFSSSPASEEEDGPERRPPRSPQTADQFEPSSPFRIPAAVDNGPSSFAAVMDDHSDSLGLNPIGNDLTGPGGSDDGVSDGKLRMKEQENAVLTGQLAELGALLEDAQQETELRSEQASLLKAEVRMLEAKLAAAEKLQNGAPFSYLRTIVVRYLETDDPTLLPVIANVLSFTKEESARIKSRANTSKTSIAGSSQKSGYFSLSFLGSR